MKLLLPCLMLFMAGSALADPDEIPLNELGFIEAIPMAGKARIVEQLGEPAKAVDLADESGVVHASIWHYRYLNTSEQGDYYKTTELDFVGDRVVQVIFSNSELEEGDSSATLPVSGNPDYF